MKVLGIDIGTTTISGVVLEDGRLLAADTKKNGFFLENVPEWEKSQDVAKIVEQALSLVEDCFEEFPDIERIGITGQMHGMLYLDGDGHPVSPLYTWQDARGDQPYGGSTFVGYLKEKTGYPVATGYGLVTHAYNQIYGLVPEEAKVLCTIGDYLGMVLAGAKVPVIDKSNGASLGFFDVEQGCFDGEALKKVGISSDILPQIVENPQIGVYRNRAKIYAAIGDNQASFLGAMGGGREGALVNVGTGSQFSVYSEEYRQVEGLETRPMPGNGYLIVGASLCGGRAYALLENFYRQTAKMLGADMASCYEAMEKMLEAEGCPADVPAVTPLFQGTRQDPSLTGKIEGLNVNNFTPLHLTWGLMQGMAEELYQMHQKSGTKPEQLVGSGNGLRKNKHLQKCMERVFGLSLVLSEVQEEAAVGAALCAAQ